MSSNNNACEQGFEFALVLIGINSLTTEIENALFEAGCDDATIGVQYGNVYMQFTRTAKSLKDAILSAIRDVRKANIGADVYRVDECDLVTQSDIARRINRPRQVVHQFVTGERGPGGFPAPACHITDGHPIWHWCAVSYWLWQNNIIEEKVLYEAQVVAAINNALERAHQCTRNPRLVEEVTAAVANV